MSSKKTDEKILNMAEYQMQIKTTVKRHFRPVRMANMESLQVNAGEGVEKEEPSSTW